MTQEEAKLVLDSLTTWIGQERLITEEIVEAIKTLSKPSLPSNLDEAAYNRVTENGRFKVTDFEKMRIDDIAFGAEWMAGQGEMAEGGVVATSTSDFEKDYFIPKL